MNSTRRFQQILGIRFFVGDAQGAVDLVSERGGLVVVPSAPTLKDLASDESSYCTGASLVVELGADVCDAG